MLARPPRRPGPALLADCLDRAVAGFGHPEPDNNIGGEPGLKLSQKLRRKRRRAVEQTDGVVGVLGRRRVFRQHRHHHPDKVDHRSPRLPHLPPKPRYAEAVYNNQRSPRGQGAHSRIILNVGVVKRQAGEKAVARRGLRPMRETLPGGDIHPVRDHHPLGVAGSAGGVDQHRHIIRRNLGRGSQWRCRGESIAERRPSGGRRVIIVGFGPPHNAMPDPGSQIRRPPRHIRQRRVGDQGHGPGVVQDVGGFVAAVGGVDRNADRPQFRQPKPAVQIFDAIGHQQANPVAPPHAQLPEHRRRPQNPVTEIAISIGRAADFHKGFAGIGGGNALQRPPDGGLPGQRHFTLSPLPVSRHNRFNPRPDINPPPSVLPPNLPRRRRAVNKPRAATGGFGFDCIRIQCHNRRIRICRGAG